MGGDDLEFTREDKKNHLKAFTNILKDAKGKGPRNIYIKYYEEEIQVIVQGGISEYEKYLIKNFGKEAVELLTQLHLRDLKNVEENFKQLLHKKHDLKIYELETDFINDIFVWKIRVEG